MKTGKRIALLALVLALGAGIIPAVPARAAQGPEVTAKEEKIVYEAQEQKDLCLVVKNNSEEEMSQITVCPVTDIRRKIYPFEVTNRQEKQVIETLEAGEEKEVVFTFRARKDVADRFYKVPFQITALEGEVKTETKVEIVVETKALVKEQQSPEKEPQTPQTEPQVSVNEEAGTAVYNAEPVSSGGSAENGSVPRVIVTGFSTDPEQVRAGTNFRLKIQLKNTSRTTAVKNMLFDLSAPTEGADQTTAAPAFLPVSGSSSIYLEGIGAGKTGEISIDLNAKSDLVQKPYNIEISMKYEDASASQFESTSSLSIPVRQDPRFEFSGFEISPGAIAVGEEANVMCSLYNLGRVKLYNAKAIFTGEGIEKEELFLGNIEPGATASIDAMLEGSSATGGPVEMTMTLTYEDDSGNISSTEQKFQMEVTERVEQTDMTEFDMAEDTPEGFPIVPVLAVVILAAALGGGIWVRRRKKRKRMEEEEERLADEFDRLTENEPGESEAP